MFEYDCEERIKNHSPNVGNGGSAHRLLLHL